MEAVCTFETSVCFSDTTRCYIPESRHLLWSLLMITMWDFKFSRRRVWCSELSSGIYCVRTSETSVDNHFTRQYIPEDSSQQNDCHLCEEMWAVRPQLLEAPFIPPNLRAVLGRAMGLTISCLPLTAEAWASPYGIYGGQSDTETGFCPSSVLPCQQHSTVVLHGHISSGGWTVGHIGGCISDILT
jgi:hypothetical protein